MSIHHTFKLGITEHQNEPMYIFNNSLNTLYLLITQIIYMSLHTGHPNKTILLEMVDMFQQRTQITTLHKVRVHSKIQGNEIANKLPKQEDSMLIHSPYSYTNMHTQHHTTYKKKIGKAKWLESHIKDLSDTYKDTLSNIIHMNIIYNKQPQIFQI